MLEKVFHELTAKYIINSRLIEKLWTEIRNNYSAVSRHYHTLTHLENMFSEITLVKEEITDANAILFALFYHDIVYLPTSNKNEERSADLAEARLLEIGFERERIIKCKQTILATKLHDESSDSDVNYLLDTDLAILGQAWDDYLSYTNNIRKEFAIYPDLIYKSGRKKVLNRFLKMPRIYKTDFFFEKFEQKAKENLKREIGMQ